MSAAGVTAFLPGELVTGRGTAADYRALARFHYLAGGPATWAGVWVVRYVGKEGREGGDEEEAGRVVAVAVLSWPTVNSAVREEVLGLAGWERGRRLAFVNEHVRTISRVIVHPQFRGVGVASGLVRRVCEACPTRWVEAFAVMGRVNPFFEKGGMREFGAAGGRPVYYLLDKGGASGVRDGRLRGTRGLTRHSLDTGFVTGNRLGGPSAPSPSFAGTEKVQGVIEADEPPPEHVRRDYG